MLGRIIVRPHGDLVEAQRRIERNGSEVFRSSNSELARAYLGIWLAPEGLSDSLREQLLADR